MNLLSQNLLQTVDLVEHERQTLMAKALAYYDGDQPKDILKVERDKPDDNVSVNYAGTIVEKGVSFLFGDELDIEIGEESDESGEDYLDEVWPGDTRHCDLIDLATSGGIFGHAWLKIVLENGRPQISILDPLNMSAKRDPRQYKRVLYYRNQYNTVDDQGRPIIWREDSIHEGNQWVIVESYSKPDQANWIEVSRIPWRYEFAPVFECKNLPKPLEFYGRADLSKYVLSLCFYIARVDSLINKIIRAHASPKPVAKGLRKQELEIGAEQILFLPDKEASLDLLEMSGDLVSAMAFRKQLREALAEVSHVPEIATGKLDSVGQLSGLALKILYGPLVDQTSKKRRLYGKLIKDVVNALLTIGGIGAQQVELRWPSMLPGDDATDWNVALVKNQLGVSKDTILREHGYDSEQELQKSNNESKALGESLLSSFEKGQQGEDE